MRSFGKVFDLLTVLAVVEIIIRTSTYLSTILAPSLLFIDTDNAFAWSWIHHIIQLLMAVGVMLLYPGMRLRDWGFNLDNRQLSLRIALKFSTEWIGCIYRQ